MRARAIVLFGLKSIVLTLILFALYAVDFSGRSLSEQARTAPAMLLLVSLLQAAVLSYPIVRARWSGGRGRIARGWDHCFVNRLPLV